VDSQERFFKKLLELYDSRGAFFLEKWKRLLPFNEMIIDRWEKSKKLGFEQGASIYDSSLVIGEVKVGKQTWIGPFTILDGSGGGLTIGNYCSVSVGTQIYTHDTVKWAVSGGKAESEKAPTTIGNCVYIGPLGVITKGVKIGDHCIIGAFSYVNREIPDFSIAIGQPAKIVGRVRLKENGDVGYEYFDL
jgi:acetyltransferase-like isoleucine patch superfamily enzyme